MPEFVETQLIPVGLRAVSSLRVVRDKLCMKKTFQLISRVIMYVNIDLHNAFHVTGLILYPLKTRGFLMFSGGIERKETSGIKWVKKLKLGRFPLGY